MQLYTSPKYIDIGCAWTKNAWSSDTFDCGKPAKLYYQLAGAKSSGNTTCTAYLQGSNDKSFWSNAVTWNLPSYGGSTSGEVDGYRYYRIYKSAAGGSNVTDTFIKILAFVIE